MKIFEPFLHFFTPRHSNNHRAKAIQNSTLSFYIALLLILQIGITAVAKFNPEILGYASNITVSDLLTNTNQKRAAAGVGSLQIDGQLSAAAAAKAADMLANQYWAHTSPQGRDPWSFIVAAGYNYLFAGENLARDFGDSASVVAAWMNSPTHRDNLLNSRYKDVGFAVVNGKYGDHETTLVVEEFGARPASAPTVETTSPSPPIAKPVPGSVPASPAAETKKEVSATKSAGQILNVETPQSSGPKFNPFTLTRNISFGLVFFLIGVFIVDGLLVYKRKVVRLSGHNFAHLLLLLAVLAALNLIGRGVIL